MIHTCAVELDSVDASKNMSTFGLPFKIWTSFDDILENTQISDSELLTMIETFKIQLKTPYLKSLAIRLIVIYLEGGMYVDHDLTLFRKPTVSSIPSLVVVKREGGITWSTYIPP